MVKTEDNVSDTPTKKELYYGAEVKIRCRMAVATEIQDRLRPGSARSELFRGTCFGPWLDVRTTSSDSSLIHLMLQTEYTPVVHQDALFFRVGDQELRFGPQEFCLITGLRFGSQEFCHITGRRLGPHHCRQGMADMTFRERVFGHVQARIKVMDLKNVFDSSLDQLSDLDAVRLCLLMLLEVGFMGVQYCSLVDSALLELVEDPDSWNTFPWGSYAWKAVYEQLHNALAKRSSRRALGPLNYSLSGFIWAFEIWIFEVFPYSMKFANKHGGIPRAICWDKKRSITWKLALPFVVDAKVPGFEPLPVLTPTPAECATDWWRASCQFFDSYANDSSSLLKKARLLSPPQPSVMVCDQLVNDIGNSTTMLLEDIVGSTTMPSSNNTTSHQSTGWSESMDKTMVENKLQKPLVITCLTSLDTHDAGKLSSQSDITCVQGYKVKQSVALILENIFNKHGDIAADCVFKPVSMRSSFLEIVCEVVSRIQTNDDMDNMEEIEQQVLAIEAANVNVSWLRAHLDVIRKRKEASKKCSLLMEMKVNTSLVKKAAQMDLRESFVELMAAQERFKKAERCVRVLRLVENTLNDNILESKGNIDSWARQPVL